MISQFILQDKNNLSSPVLVQKTMPPCRDFAWISHEETSLHANCTIYMYMHSLFAECMATRSLFTCQGIMSVTYITGT